MRPIQTLLLLKTNKSQQGGTQIQNLGLEIQTLPLARKETDGMGTYNLSLDALVFSQASRPVSAWLTNGEHLRYVEWEDYPEKKAKAHQKVSTST